MGKQGRKKLPEGTKKIIRSYSICPHLYELVKEKMEGTLNDNISALIDETFRDFVSR